MTVLIILGIIGAIGILIIGVASFFLLYPSNKKYDTFNDIESKEDAAGSKSNSQCDIQSNAVVNKNTTDEKQ